MKYIAFSSSKNVYGYCRSVGWPRVREAIIARSNALGHSLFSRTPVSVASLFVWSSMLLLLLLLCDIVFRRCLMFLISWQLVFFFSCFYHIVCVCVPWLISDTCPYSSMSIGILIRIRKSNTHQHKHRREILNLLLPLSVAAGKVHGVHA